MDMAGSTIHNRFNASYIRLPGAVASSVGMGNLDSKSDTFAADVAFCHRSAPPSTGFSTKSTLIYYQTCRTKSRGLGEKFDERRNSRDFRCKTLVFSR